MNAPPFNSPAMKEASQLDDSDDLRHLRNLFNLPPEIVYLDGNSLGAMPKATKAVLEDAVSQQWANDLIRSWNNNDWIGAPQRIGSKIAPLLGVKATEVIVADSVSVNIFKLLSAVCRNCPDRTRIVTETGSFPTDAHVAQGVADAMNLQLKLEPRQNLLNSLDDQTAAVLLSHVHYKTGDRYDMAAVNQAADQHGISVIWDLSHSVGAVPLDLLQTGCQFAVGCGYKYLNGGPGAPSFLYVKVDQQSLIRSPLQGWMGDAAPFEFEDEYRAAPGMDRFLVGTPPILSLLALECGVETFADVDTAQLWNKSQALFDFLVRLMDLRCPEMTLMTPEKAELRGSHASFSHPHSWPINNALIAKGIIGDFRTPDVLRFGLTPMYTGFKDIAQAVETLAEILATEEWKQHEYNQAARVT